MTGQHASPGVDCTGDLAILCATAGLRTACPERIEDLSLEAHACAYAEDSSDVPQCIYLSASSFATLSHPSEMSSLESISCLVYSPLAVRLSWCLIRIWDKMTCCPQIPVILPLLECPRDAVQVVLEAVEDGGRGGRRSLAGSQEEVSEGHNERGMNGAAALSSTFSRLLPAAARPPPPSVPHRLQRHRQPGCSDSGSILKANQASRGEGK
ncbi:uncharacterized protein LOC142414080 [Mycteria americana]|uniref:uncharacterized protein LOC142414080 n=1 Tax=Mycteria americana TaxID=33587 RepID=UPI003F589938